MRRGVSRVVRVLQRFADRTRYSCRETRKLGHDTVLKTSPFGRGAAPHAINQQTKGLPAPELWIFLRFRTSSRRCPSSLDTRRHSCASRGSLRLVPQDSKKLCRSRVLFLRLPLSWRCIRLNTKIALAVRSAGLCHPPCTLRFHQKLQIGIKESVMPSALLSYCQTHGRATRALTRFGTRPTSGARGRRRCSPFC